MNRKLFTYKAIENYNYVISRREVGIAGGCGSRPIILGIGDNDVKGQSIF
jgi:hypothetical protein